MISREVFEVGDAGSGASPESVLTSVLVFGSMWRSADGSTGGQGGSGAAVRSEEGEALGISAST